MKLQRTLADDASWDLVVEHRERVIDALRGAAMVNLNFHIDTLCRLNDWLDEHIPMKDLEDENQYEIRCGWCCDGEHRLLSSLW